MRRVFTLTAAATSTALAVTWLPLVSGAAVPPLKTSFRLTDAVDGTLAAADKKCQGEDASFSFANAAGGSQGGAWTVFVTTPTTRGTWKKFGRSAADQTKLGVQLQNESSNGDTEWITQSGTIATDHGSGRVNVTLGIENSYNEAPGSPRIHLIGSWGCTTSS